MEQYFSAAAIGACGVAAFVFGGRLLRPRFPIRVNCWFCDKNSIVPYGNRNCWDCPHCDQYNGFDEDGNYNKAIPAQFSETLNSLRGSSASQESTPPQQPVTQQFCADCNRNQLIKIKQLAAFTPLHEETFDDEVDRFKKRLDVTLALCGSCQAKAEAVIDQQNRSLMYDIATDAIFKTKHRSEDDVSFLTADGGVDHRRKSRFRWAARILNLFLVCVAISLSISYYSRHYKDLLSRFPSAPPLPPSSFSPSSSIGHFLSVINYRSLAFVFVGVFLALASVSLKNEARVYVGYLDLATVMSWLSWLVAKLIVDHALHLPAASSGRLHWVAKRVESLIYPAVVIFAVLSTIINFVVISFQKSKSWRSVRKITMRKSPSSNFAAKTTPTQLGASAFLSSPTRYVNPAYSQTTSDKAFNLSPPDVAVPPTSTPPSGSRPPSPTGSIVGQGVELRMGDIAGMTLSTGLTPKKKTNRGGRGGGGGGGGSVFAGSTVWGNVGLNCSLSSSGSSLDKKKSKTIISPARFTGSQPRNILPSALFGSSSNSGRPLANLTLGNSSSRPSSPLGWGTRDSFGASANHSPIADDALSTVSAPSRFAASTGAGLFSGFSPQPSQATTPRGSDNTSNSDHDWLPPSAAPVTSLFGAPAAPRVAASPTAVGNSNNHAIDDTFTDDSDSEGSRCLADATMKNVDMPSTPRAAPHYSRGRRKRVKEVVPHDDGGYFMKIVAVVSVVANVVLAFYLGTMMKS